MSATPEAIIPVSRKTLRWLRQGRPTHLGWRRGASYAWNAFWFDVNAALQKRLTPETEPALPANPVFILGLWRSGTTFAHELLNACPGLTAPTTRQCMNASTFMLTGRQARNATVSRPMDAMEISQDSPQEDEFALLSLGIPTVYRAFLDPGRIEEQARLLSPDYWVSEAPSAWHGEWLAFLRAVQGQTEAGARLVIKSPGHSFRVKAIEGIFPESRYVWITRSPAELLHSNRRMWMAMFKRYGMNGVDPQRLDRFLLQAFEQAASCLDWLCGRMGADRLAVIDFSRLAADPAAVIAATGQGLGLGERPSLYRACETALRERGGYRREQYRPGLLSAEEERALAILRASQDRALASHGLTDR